MKRKAQHKPLAVVQVQTEQLGIHSKLSGRPTDVEIHISQCAYELYSARGGEGGHEMEDWLRAEKEIMRA